MIVKTSPKLRFSLALLTALALIAIVAASALSASKTKTVRIAVKANGKEVPMSNSEYVALSADGRYAAYEATGRLTSKDRDNDHDVYVYDRKTRKNTLVSVKSNGKQAKGAGCAAADISPNGRYVSFGCDGPLVTADQNGLPDVYLHDLKSGKTTLISVKGDGSQLNGVDDGSEVSGVSNNGRVAWESQGAFVAGDTNNAYDLFVRNPKAGTTERASVDYQGNQLANGVGSLNPDKASKLPISADGTQVAFTSPNQATAGGDYGLAVDTDVFVRNLSKGKTTRVSVKSNGQEASPNQNASSSMPSMSANGRYVAFQADPTAAFVAGDTNNGYDIYVRDRKKGKTTLVIGQKRRLAADACRAGAAVRGDLGQRALRGIRHGRPTTAAVPIPPAGRDVYLRDLQRRKTKLVSVTYKGKRADDNQIADVSNNAYVGCRRWARQSRAPTTAWIGTSI